MSGVSRFLRRLIVLPSSSLLVKKTTESFEFGQWLSAVHYVPEGVPIAVLDTVTRNRNCLVPTNRFSPSLGVPTGSGSHPDSHSVHTACCLPGVRRPIPCRPR